VPDAEARIDKAIEAGILTLYPVPNPSGFDNEDKFCNGVFVSDFCAWCESVGLPILSYVREEFDPPIPNWPYWTRLPTWTIEQAAALLCEIEPGYFDGKPEPAISIELRSAVASDQFGALKGLARVGAREIHLPKQEVVKWARRAGISIPAALGTTRNKKPNTNPVGTPKRRDKAMDKRILAAWDSGAYKRYEECAQEFGLSESEVRRAVDARRNAAKRKNPESSAE